MYGDCSREIRREFSGSGARFDLPVRPLGRGRIIGLVFVGVGLAFMWSPAGDVWRAVHKWRDASHSGIDLLAGLFHLPFLIVGGVALVIGLFILFGRCCVEWKDGRLRSTEVLGPLRWTRRLPRRPVRKLEVSAATSKSGTAPPQQFEKFSGLLVEFEDGSTKVIALGYPKDWLLELAQELRNYVSGDAFSAAAADVEIVETSPKDASDEDVPEQPAGSAVQVQERATSVRLIVPPAGLWRGSKGLFFFALLWCGFMVFFTAFSAKTAFKGDRIEWVVLAFLAAFWAIGLGLLAGAINMGCRSARLAAESGRLRVEINSLFGKRQQEWDRSDLTAVRADASGMEVNNRPLMELQIYPRGRKKVGLLAGREEDELRWMATRLRQVLDVPARTRESSSR